MEGRAMQHLMTMVLAGGKGERLYRLTQHRAKRAVAFAGKYQDPGPVSVMEIVG
jgi:ADP-glucose pyrophosphorylase